MWCCTYSGDGTYLRASSKIVSTDKPLIGVNSDPERWDNANTLNHKMIGSNFQQV